MGLIIHNEEGGESLTITNPDIINLFINTRQSFLKIIDLSYHLFKSVTPIISNCTNWDKINNKIDELKNTLEPFNTGGNSSKNGKIGEIFASEHFQKSCSDIVYQDTSKIEKSGDAILLIQHHLVGRIMIDYKNYDKAVPSDESNKLIRDMDTQNIRYGLLVSYRSKIIKRKYIDYEIIDNKLIVFLSCCEMNFIMLEMAIQYLQKLCECNTLSMSQQINELTSKSTMKKMTDVYEKLFHVNQKHSQDINTIKEYLDKVSKMFHTMISNAYESKSSMNLLLEDIDNEIKEIHREPITNSNSYIELNEYIDHVFIFIIRENFI